VTSPPGVGSITWASGRPAARVEDSRLLLGRGRFVADLRAPDMVEAAFVRARLPHAVIRSIDVGAAVRADGVIGAFTAGDMEPFRSIPHFDQPHREVENPPLCQERVRYVGGLLAVVVATDRYVAEDACELVEVDLDTLPSVTTVDQALAPDAPRLHESWPNNVAFASVVGDAAAAAPAFTRYRIVRNSVEIQRQAPVPLETRGVVAEWRDDRLTIWTSTQIPQIVRSVLAHVLGLPETDVRVVVPDVGGGFGGKAEVYPEECVVAWLAMRLGRPVRWIEDRYEHMIASCHARDMRISLEAAVSDDGRIHALRGRIDQNLGAGSMYPNGVAPAFIAAAELPGPYRIPHVCVEVRSVVTNLTPSGAYRGFGVPEAVFAMERLIDHIAQDLGIERVELRRRMTIRPEDLPYTTATGARIDSGSHLAALEAVAERTREEHARWTARLSADPAVRVGWGIASWIQGTAPSFYGTSGRWSSADACHIQFDADGGVTVAAGVSAYGQGTKTMLTTLVADALRLPADSVRVVVGDTDRMADGIGSWGSRSTVVMAGAVERAAAQLVRKATAIAAHMLEAAPEDVELADGRFAIRGSPERAVRWSRVALAAMARTIDLPPDVEPGLDAKAVYRPPVADAGGAAAYTNSAHGAVVAVDTRTGAVRLLCLVIAQDSGRILNRDIVVGQLHGGAAQGVGTALLERFVYDEDGTPLSMTLMDYELPTAPTVPEMHISLFESPAPNIPYGVKGVGEAGIVGPPPAIAAAVDHALARFGPVHVARTPIIAADILAAIRCARPQPFPTPRSPTADRSTRA
jgi:aerobic carbon-monoxide dehydrogenase large subunit